MNSIIHLRVSVDEILRLAPARNRLTAVHRLRRFSHIIQKRLPEPSTLLVLTGSETPLCLQSSFATFEFARRDMQTEYSIISTACLWMEMSSASTRSNINRGHAAFLHRRGHKQLCSSNREQLGQQQGHSNETTDDLWIDNIAAIARPETCSRKQIKWVSTAN